MDIDHAEDDRRQSEQQALQLEPEQALQRTQQHAVLDEEQHPAIEADVLGDEQRDGEEQGQQHRPAAEHPHQPVGDGVADERQQADHQARQPERPQEGDVVGALEHREVVDQLRRRVEGEGAGRHHAEPDHRQQRCGESDQQEQEDRQRRAAARRQAQAGGELHSSATRMLSRASQPIRTSSSSAPAKACWRSFSTRKTRSPTRTWYWTREPSTYSL